MRSIPLSHETTKRLIQDWLKVRQACIVTLNQLCQLRPFVGSDHPLLRGSLQEFCEHLMDYASYGHFRVFEHLMQVIEKSQPQSANLCSKLLAALTQTTHYAVDFNDRQQTMPHLNNLEDELSMLAEQMALRLEWEDKLIHLAQAA